MAIVALQLVGLSVDQALIGNIVEANGGDIRLNAELAPLRQSDLAFFDKLQQQRRIDNYATAYDPGGSIGLPAGGEESFAFIAVSSNFPLVGQANFIAPSSNLTIQSVVNGRNVAMSSIVFNDLHAHIGSTYKVKTLDGRYVPITVAAEFQEDGVFRGPQVIISASALAAIPGPNGAVAPAQYGTIYMTMPQADLNTVVITALGIKRSEKSLTYATQQVSGDQLTNVKTDNLMNSLNGKVAGLTISPSASGSHKCSSATCA